MIQRIFTGLLVFLISLNSFAQDHHPGGVTGAEAWYIVNHSDLDQQIYTNYGTKNIKITPCSTPIGNKSLFNFNYSVSTNNLCLFYNAELENTTTRNVFFVGEPQDNITNYSHLTTQWNTQLLSLPQTDSLVHNRFDLATNNSNFNKKLSGYTSVNNANINFYHWNLYQTDRKFKSYGYTGETSFYIGKTFQNPLSTAEYYKGNFPEFICYPFELTANEKNRVESYLALKYGITLDKNQSYLNSKNLIFWNNVNNIKFGSRIFGIGRDDISWLNQLQSESVHEKDFLVKSVKELQATNPKKQQNTVINDNHFIVSGDNGGNSNLEKENALKIRLMNRKWLAQITGKDSYTFNIFFKLNLAGALQAAIKDNPKLKIWMLHDKYVTNQEVSDFTSQYVNYYEPVNPGVTDYAYFEDVYFDTDNNIYDQYTFGVGPEMIVQVRFDPNCESRDIKTYVVITGGKAPYDIKINSEGGDSQHFNTHNTTTAFSADAPDTYTILVTDSGGNSQEVIIDVNASLLDVDLGPDKVLSATTPQFTLDADQSANDPEATYKWYRNGGLLENFNATLLVDEPGEYTVEVMAGNHSCVKTDSIKISYNFKGSATQITNCNDLLGTISLNLTGGIPPYTTIITGTGQTVYQVHNTNTTILQGIDFGPRTITTTDSQGSVYQTTITLQAPLEGIELNLAEQISSGCTFVTDDPYPIFSCGNVTSLNAGALVTNSNVYYDWYMNGQPVNIHTPTVNWIQSETQFPGVNGGFNEFMVVVTNLNTGCSASETFGAWRFWGITPGSESVSMRKDNNAATNESENTEKGMISKVYPNPSASGATFYYEVSADNVFAGTIEIFSPTGALLHQETISGKTTYTLPFNLSTSGVYIIRTQTNQTTLTDKVIIK